MQKQVKPTKKQAVFLMLTIFVFLVSVSSVSAASPAPMSSQVYVSTNGSDANNGSAEAPYLTIQKGLDSVSSNGTVNIANGVYSGTGNTNISIQHSVNIIGQSQTGTIINGTGTNWIFYIPEDVTVTIQNLTITNATIDGDDGGAIYNDGTLTATNCTFSNNYAEDGGAIYNDGVATLTGCSFKGNAAYVGGAIYTEGGNLTVTNCNFSNNTANGDFYPYYGGAAIYNNGGALNVTNSNFTGNDATASDSAAVYNYGGTLNVTGSTFTENKGGVLINDGSNDYEGNMNVTNSNFTGNTAIYSGAAICDYYGTSTVRGCTFVNNTAGDDGGAIWNDGGNFTVGGCNFLNNTAGDDGGAICNEYGTLTVNFSRIVGNTASYGTALYNYVEAPEFLSDQEVPQSVDVRYNWWGSNTNPKLVSNLIAGDFENVDADPWLILSINATPSEIINTKTSNVTVDLYTDSNNNSHSTESAKYPAVIPVTFSTTWGSITQAVLNYGTGVATFTANGGPIPTPNVAIVSAADSANLTANVSTNITIKPAANLYVTIKSTKNNPNVGETFTLTYKLGNKGPDAANNVKITIPVPENFEVSSITGDGNWTYNAATRTITWTLANVPVGDPYLYITGKTTKAGVYSFGSSIASDTYNLNTDGVTPVTINAATEVNAASNTVAMQNTGLPLNYLILAILAVISGFVVPRRK